MRFFNPYDLGGEKNFEWFFGSKFHTFRWLLPRFGFHFGFFYFSFSISFFFFLLIVYSKKKKKKKKKKNSFYEPPGEGIHYPTRNRNV